MQKIKRQKTHTMNKVRNAFNIITIAVVSIDILFRNKLPLVIRNNSWIILSLLVITIIVLEILRRNNK